MTEYENYQAHICTEPTTEMFAYLARHIRPADSREGEAFSGYPHTPEVWIRELEEARAGSVLTHVVFEHDLKTPLAVYGAVEPQDYPGYGYLWMSATRAVNRHRHSFLKLGRFSVARLQLRFNELLCYADSRNAVHNQWLRWVGFEAKDYLTFADPDVKFIGYQLTGGREAALKTLQRGRKNYGI